MVNKNTKTALKEDTETLKKDLEKIITDAQDMLKQSADDLVVEKVQAARDKLIQTRERLIDQKDLVSEKTQECIHNCENRIQSNPWAATGIALGAGILIGMVSRRR